MRQRSLEYRPGAVAELGPRNAPSAMSRQTIVPHKSSRCEARNSFPAAALGIVGVRIPSCVILVPRAVMNITTLERRAGCALASYRTRNPHYGSDSLTVRRTTRIYRPALLVRWNRAYGNSLSSSTFLVQLSTRPRSKTERH